MTAETRSLAVAAAAALAAGALIAALEGPGGGLVVGGVLLVLGAGTVLVAQRLGLRRAQPLRRFVRSTAALAVGQILVAVAVFAVFMFVSAHDAVLVTVVAAVSGLVAVLASRDMTAGVLRDVDRLRDGLEQVGRGRRDVRLEMEGADELAAVADSANDMIARLAGQERARRDLVAAVSHDLRTPLTSLRLLAAALEDDMVDPEQQREHLQRMTTHITALGALVDDLFELSRLQAGDLHWSIERVALAELVGETVDALQVHAARKGVSVVAELPPGLTPAHANPERLQRVLFNLIQNAIRHTPADGSVTVRAEPTADGVTIEVVDTGEGVPAADRERVFAPFVRGSGGEARNDGAGLGLAISRAIVEAHGGRIWFEDVAAGARVRFLLPAATTAPRTAPR